jgi:RimJ/RimL family protein N-acetyltransferase
MDNLETKQCKLVKFTLEDKEFIFKLLNDPMWIAEIGDRNIRTLEDAENYIKNGPFQLYEKYGLGPLKVSLKDGANTPIGMCGLFKRDVLEHPDLGFAFLSEFTGKGFGKETSNSIIEYARDTLKLQSLLGIVSPSNIRSQRLLLSLGFQYIETIPLYDKETMIFKLAL